MIICNLHLLKTCFMAANLLLWQWSRSTGNECVVYRVSN